MKTSSDLHYESHDGWFSILVEHLESIIFVDLFVVFLFRLMSSPGDNDIVSYLDNTT